MKPYLSVIIPAYNEEKRIGATLEAVHAYLTAQPFSWEVVIVLDGVTDNTLGVIQTFAQGKENIRWVNRLENRGKGYTIRQGMLEANGEIRLFTDADNSTDMSHFDKMRPYFESGRQVVIASRDHKDHPDAQQAVPQPFFKRLLGNMGNLVIQILAVPGIWDTQCGYKAFTAEAAEKIFSVARIKRWGIDIEALALARKFNYKIAVIGAHWIDNADTHVRVTDYFDTFWEAFKVRWNLITGKYNKKAPLPAAGSSSLQTEHDK
ncbi:MAG: glycosyltransferase family 2 protein [Anaerolineales bacterium]|nr:glycosyltransferase family 2 protein [Anaerolineales bacterium]